MKGRMSKVEVDVLRSAIILSSAGLDATMQRLVNDVAPELIRRQGSAACAQYQAYLKAELGKSQVSDGIRNAVISTDATEQLLAHYLAERTRASFQGSSELKRRVRQALGIPNSAVADADLESLDEFFQARNKIAHSMDLKNPDTESVARIHRTRDEVADLCTHAFEVAALLVRETAKVLR